MTMENTTDTKLPASPPLPAPAGSEILTTDEKLAEDRKRLAFLRSKAKYAPPVKGMYGGAWQITLTVGPGETIAPDFFDAVDRARQLPNVEVRHGGTNAPDLK